jgi:2-polyprenyl-3-methyl-5-hydroxy-6-metoxy-1,4-benzoquinol methylase
MSKLSQRSTQSELMDRDATSPEDYARCLHDLAALNRVTRTHRPTLHWLDRVTKHLPVGAHISVLDVACGHGDLLRAIHSWAARRGLLVSLSGIDLNPRSRISATAATPPEMAITYHIGDVFEDQPSPRPDFIVSSQFAHHLNNEELVRFLIWLDRHAARGWLITDLHRHPIPYYGFRLLALVAGWHRIVRIDGTISIARGFRSEDWQRALAAAGLTAAVSWRFPFRLTVGYVK